MKKRSLMLFLAALAVCTMIVAFCSVAAAEIPKMETPIRHTSEEAEAASEARAPKVIIKENGIRVQRTPESTKNVYGRVVKSWNNLYMNADNRGCQACHTLEAALDMIPTFHGAFFLDNNTELTLWTCFGCHGFEDDTEFRDALHTTHMNSSVFNTMNGSCESCHYMDKQGNYLVWDFVKYDILRGIADIPADQMDITTNWNQSQITPTEKIFYKNIKSEPDEWLLYDDQITKDVYKNWTISVSGDMDNPFVMTIEEMIEQFGTVTQVMKANCVINGIGSSMIFQAEVTGIPVSKIIEYAQIHDDANMFYPVGDDGYCYNCYTQEALDLRAMIVLEINGITLPAAQGFPASFWADEMSCGNFSKRVNEIRIEHSDGHSYALYGWVVDPDYGDYFNKPNMGVLNAPSGVILEKGEPIHFEGFADAWDEPIIRLEYSFDHGTTWIEVPTKDSTTLRWVYWTLDVNNKLDPGSYLIKMRATSLRHDGTERVMYKTADFLFNVK